MSPTLRFARFLYALRLVGQGLEDITWNFPRTTYEVLDTTSGDVLADYPSLDAARGALSEYVGAHSYRRDELAITEVDATGHVRGWTPLAWNFPRRHP